MTAVPRGEKLVSANRRFVWVGVPKAATRSLLTVLYRNPPVDLGTEEFMEPLADILRDHPDYRDFFVFAFVRNPWSRAVSAWKDKVVEVNEDKAKAILRHHPALTPGMPFEDFVDFLVEEPDGRDEAANPHWLSQHLFLRDAAGELVTDFVGRVESMADDFAVVAERIGLPSAELPVLNTRFGWKPTRDERAEAVRLGYYRDHYTDRTRDMIAERYAEDIELFGYAF